MIRRIGLLGVFAAALVVSQPAQAAMIEIQLGGVNAVYDGFVLADAGDPFGGNQDPAESDALAFVNFLADGVLVGTLNANIYADFAFIGLEKIPVGGGTAVASFGGFFDVLTSASGWGIGLDLLDPFAFSYDAGAGVLTGRGVATGILGQNLPFGLIMGTPVQISLLFDSLSNVTSAGGFLTGFDAEGGAVLVPEPASQLLLGMGAVVLGIRRFRRTSR